MSIAIYTLTSELHNEEAVATATRLFLDSLDINYALRGNDYADYGAHDLDLIYVRTGGTEGIFRRLLPTLLQPSTRPFRLLTSGGSNSLAAAMEILSFLRQQGLQGEILHGTPTYISARIRLLAKAEQAVASLRGQRLGVIGEPSDWLISSHVDPALVSRQLGIELISLPIQEVIDEFQSIQPDAPSSPDAAPTIAPSPEGPSIAPSSEGPSIAPSPEGPSIVPSPDAAPSIAPTSDSSPSFKAVPSFIDEFYSSSNPAPSSPPSSSPEASPYIDGAVRIYAALRSIIERHALDGFTIRCFDLLSALHNTGCLALARLNAEGFIAGCEGDVPAMLSMAVARALTGVSGFQANPARIDPETGTLLFAHCTIPLNMVERYELDTHFESGIGVGIRGFMKPGPVTLFKLAPDLSRYFAGEGQLTTCQSEPGLCRTQQVIRLTDPQQARYFLTDPIGNHHIVIPSHCRELLEETLRLAIPSSTNK